MTIKHFLTTQDWSRAELDELLAHAAEFKRSKLGHQLDGKSIALLFFNPSMRTRTSFELGAHQLGGKAIVLAPAGAWPISSSGSGWMAHESKSPKSRLRAVTST